jgi:hypothetical protein
MTMKINTICALIFSFSFIASQALEEQHNQLTIQAIKKTGLPHSFQRDIQSSILALPEKKTVATGTTMKAFQEYQSWSVDAMGGVFLPSQINLLFYSFGVYPRYNVFAPKDYFSISAGVPANIGFSFSAGPFGTFIQFMGDVPLTIDLNIGSRATPFNESIFGAYVGGGINYNFMYYQINGSNTNLHSLGPVIHGGFRWTINGRETGFRISYLNGIGELEESERRNSILSISVIYGVK